MIQFDSLPFTNNDENFVEAFAIFCGMGINNVAMYEKAVVAMAKQQVICLLCIFISFTGGAAI